jgi:hypothetical protein
MDAASCWQVHEALHPRADLTCLTMLAQQCCMARNRWPCDPLACAGAELGVFMMPGNVMTYLPNWYFGGLTAWIGQDILKVGPSLLRSGEI